MSNPKLYMAMHILLGACIAVGVPAALIAYGPEYLGLNVGVAVALSLLVVLIMMSISLAAMMIMQHAPNPIPMGPSLLAGFGILNLGFLVAPVVFVPGLVWLWILPFDHNGYFKLSAAAGLDVDKIEEPNHGDTA